MRIINLVLVPGLLALSALAAPAPFKVCGYVIGADEIPRKTIDPPVLLDKYKRNVYKFKLRPHFRFFKQCYLHTNSKGILNCLTMLADMPPKTSAAGAREEYETIRSLLAEKYKVQDFKRRTSRQLFPGFEPSTSNGETCDALLDNGIILSLGYMTVPSKDPFGRAVTAYRFIVQFEGRHINFDAPPPDQSPSPVKQSRADSLRAL